METKHTPGPWTTKQIDNNTINVRTPTDINTCIAKIIHPFMDTTAYHNACLVASAPDLLEALQAIVPDLEHYVSTHGPGPDKRLETVKEAINKALGI